MPTDPTLPFQHTAPADVVHYFGTDAAAGAQLLRMPAPQLAREGFAGHRVVGLDLYPGCALVTYACSGHTHTALVWRGTAFVAAQEVAFLARLGHGWVRQPAPFRRPEAN